MGWAGSLCGACDHSTVTKHTKGVYKARDVVTLHDLGHSGSIQGDSCPGPTRKGTRI